MTCQEIQERLDDYVDSQLPDEERVAVELHVERCARCAEELRRQRSLVAEASALPKSIHPAHDLWAGISERIGATGAEEAEKVFHLRIDPSGNESIDSDSTVAPASLGWRRFAIAAALVAAIGGFWFATQTSSPSWQVTRLEGAPRVGSSLLASGGELAEGEWLETDETSRAQIEAGSIGQVEIEPNTRIRLLKVGEDEQRLALARGTMRATIWAPPRIFFVETPSATAIDLGCAYVLAVDDEGGGLLEVTSGFVALQLAGREAIIPAGGMCLTKPGIGPGTPFVKDVPEKFRAALMKLDFENGGIEDLTTLLREAREQDALTLSHLLSTLDYALRGFVYDRLAALVPPPQGVTREGVLTGDKEMLALWGDELGLGGAAWWDVW